MKTRFIAPLRGAILLGAVTATAAFAALADGHRPEFPLSVADARERADARFQAMDSDGSGEISPAELAAAPGPEHRGRHPGWKRHGRTDDDAGFSEEGDGALFDALDDDADGTLSRTEFSAERLREARREHARSRLFERLDRDGSGGLSRAELPDMSRRLAAMDADGDGTVTREEARAHHRRPDPAAEQADERG